MKQLPHGWRSVKIGDIFHVQQGKAVNAKAREGTNVQPFLRTANVFWNRLELSTVDQMHFSEVEAEKLRLEYDDILVCEGGDIGRTAIWKSEIEPCFYQNHLHRLRPKIREEVEPYFFSLWMQTAILLRGLYTSQGNKTTIPNLSGARLKSFDFPLPSFSEQRAIADIMGSVQGAKDARVHETQLERERKAALMAHLFAHGTRGEMLAETPLGKLPQNWKAVKLGEVLKQAQYGLSLRGETSGTYPILRMGNLIDGWVEMSDLQFVELDEKTLDQYKINFGDVLFNRTNSFELVGKTAIYESDAESIFASYLIRLIPESESLSPQFLNAYFNGNETQKRLKSIASRGVSQSNISAGNLKHFFIPLPPLDEQKEIAVILRACDDKIAALEEEATRLDELFRAMLEELMSGRLRVSDAAEQIKRD